MRTRMLMHLVMTLTTTRTTTEVVNESGPQEKTNDVRRALQGKLLQKRVLRETERTEAEAQVLKHCKQAMNMLLKYYVLVFDLNFISKQKMLCVLHMGRVVRLAFLGRWRSLLLGVRHRLLFGIRNTVYVLHAGFPRLHVRLRNH